jgi:hypothetical protein
MRKLLFLRHISFYGIINLQIRLERMKDGDPTGIVRSPSRLDHDVGLAPHELATRDERVAQLTTHFLEIATRSHSPETLDYMSGGGNLRLCLTEIMALSEPCEQDQQVRELRAEYMDRTLQRKGMIHRRTRKRQLRGAEEVYIDSVVAKIAAVVDAGTPEESLALGQMPTLVEKASFKDEPLSADDLAANHLYLLIDTALKEHVHRRHAVERRASKSKVAKVAGSRTLHMSVAASVFTAAIAPKLGVLSELGAQMTQDVETAVRVISGTILGLTAPEAARLKYLQLMHDKRTDELQDDLAGDRELADRALRMTYNSTRYGNLDGTGVVTGRSGTDDKDENLRRFARLDREFPHLNNDPGGKPYTGGQALGYAARLLIEREDQIVGLTDAEKGPEERRGLFLELARDILTEDVIRMKKGLNVSRLRRRIVNTVALIPAILFPNATSSVHEAQALSKGTTGALSGESETK